MSTTLINPEGAAELGSALAELWQRHRHTNLDRISLLEATAANVLRHVSDAQGIDAASRAAHMLAGSLGTFGFDLGSRSALEVEYLLREDAIDGLLLAEAVATLRASVPDDESASASLLADRRSDPVGRGIEASALVVSGDVDLISRLTVESAAKGMSFASVKNVASCDSLTDLPPAIVVDDDTSDCWTDSPKLHSIERLVQRAVVYVLSDSDTFEDRVALVRAGAVGVARRTQGAGPIMAFLTEVLGRRQEVESVVHACNIGVDTKRLLTEAFSAPGDHLALHESAPDLWATLPERGGAVVVAGFHGPLVTGPEMCAMIRAHPQWHRLPIVVVGDHDPAHLAEAIVSGADDYVASDVSAQEFALRLRNVLDSRRMAEARSEVDPLTGTENRTTVELSLNRQFQKAMRDGESFALGLIRVDHFERLRSDEGNAVADEVLRRLALRLVEGVPERSTVGRWSECTFAVGLSGTTSEAAAGCVDSILKALSTAGVPTTSGFPAHCTFSAGITSAPADGSSFASLERMCETALQRASVSNESVVISGNRPVGQATQVVDVVLVEDDDSIADVIEHALGLHQYGFQRFSDGAEAASALGEGRVRARIVLLDVGLPSLDGFGVLKILQSKGILSDTRVIMLTARSSEAEMLRALGLGAMEHITKPFSIPVLLGRLDQTHGKVTP